MTGGTFNLNRDCFQREMERLELALPDKEISKGLLRVYYERLGYCTDLEFQIAVNRILDNNRWFPTIKDIKKHLPPKKLYMNTPEFEKLQKEK